MSSPTDPGDTQASPTVNHSSSSTSSSADPGDTQASSTVNHSSSSTSSSTHPRTQASSTLEPSSSSTSSSTKHQKAINPSPVSDNNFSLERQKLLKALINTEDKIDRLIQILDVPKQPDNDEARDHITVPDIKVGSTLKNIAEATVVAHNHASQLVISCKPQRVIEDAVSPIAKKFLKALMETAEKVNQLPLSYGHELFRRLRKWLKSVLLCASRLLCGLRTALADPNTKNHAHSLHLVGIFWDSCNRLTSIPRDNHTAVAEVLKTTSSLLKDAAEEISAELTEAEEDNINEYIDGDDMGWSHQDIEIATSIPGIIVACQKLTAKTALLCIEDLKSVPPLLLDKISAASLALSPLADELAESLYPPLNRKDLGDQVNQLHRTTQSLIFEVCKVNKWESEFTDGQAGTPATEKKPKWLSFLEHALKHNVGKFTEALRN